MFNKQLTDINRIIKRVKISRKKRNLQMMSEIKLMGEEKEIVLEDD